MNFSNLINSSSTGRVLLHLWCGAHRPSHWHWHWRGIQRELHGTGFGLALDRGLWHGGRGVLQTVAALSVLLLASPATSPWMPGSKLTGQNPPTRLLAKRASGHEPQTSATCQENL